MKKHSFIDKLKKYKINIIITFVFTTLIAILTNIFIKNFYKILLNLGDDTLGPIFSQLKDSKVRTPFIMIIVIIFLFTCFVLKLNYKKKRVLKIVLVSILSMFLLIILLVLSILLSKVNGILFIDILVSLLKNMGGLGL